MVVLWSTQLGGERLGQRRSGRSARSRKTDPGTDRTRQTPGWISQHSGGRPDRVGWLEQFARSSATDRRPRIANRQAGADKSPLTPRSHVRKPTRFLTPAAEETPELSIRSAITMKIRVLHTASRLVRLDHCRIKSERRRRYGGRKQQPGCLSWWQSWVRFCGSEGRIPRSRSRKSPSGAAPAPIPAPTLASVGLSADRQEITTNETHQCRAQRAIHATERKSISVKAFNGSAVIPRVATIDDQGRVTARQTGETKITARYGDLMSPAWTLTVRAEKPVITPETV